MCITRHADCSECLSHVAAACVTQVNSIYFPPLKRKGIDETVGGKNKIKGIIRDYSQNHL